MYNIFVRFVIWVKKQKYVNATLTSAISKKKCDCREFKIRSISRKKLRRCTCNTREQENYDITCRGTP